MSDLHMATWWIVGPWSRTLCSREEIVSAVLTRWAEVRCADMGLNVDDVLRKHQGSHGVGTEAEDSARLQIICEMRDHGYSHVEIGRVFDGRTKESVWHLEQIGRAVCAS